MYQKEISHIKMLSDFELVQFWQDGLVARATGDDFDNNVYSFVRSELLAKKYIEKYLPKWVVQNRTVDQFWIFIKGRFSTYQARREFIWNEYTELLNFLENKVVSPLHDIISFDEGHIHTQWKKAIERKSCDPEGAITMARTLIESVLKYILDEQNLVYKEGIDLTELYKMVAKSLNLAPEQHQEQIFKQILGGANGIINGLGALRNKLGDAHGKSRANIKPNERHSELAVNLAGSMAVFLFKTYTETISKQTIICPQ